MSWCCAASQVLLCYNKLKHYKDLECAVAHELVHAYDYCRAKGLDLRNCHHHACTEVGHLYLQALEPAVPLHLCAAHLPWRNCTNTQ
jgi:hypothetical protein